MELTNCSVANPWSFQTCNNLVSNLHKVVTRKKFPYVCVNYGPMPLLLVAIGLIADRQING